MAEIYDLEVLAQNNNAAAPAGFPENMDFSDVDDAFRELMAMIARFNSDVFGPDGNASFGTTDSQLNISSPNIAISSYFDGYIIGFRMPAGTTHTNNLQLNVNSLGDVPIVNPDGRRLCAGTLPPEAKGICIYKSGVFWLLTNNETQDTYPGVFTITTGNIAIDVGPQHIYSTIDVDPAVGGTPGLSLSNKTLEFWPIGGWIRVIDVSARGTVLFNTNTPITTQVAYHTHGFGGGTGTVTTQQNSGTYTGETAQIAYVVRTASDTLTIFNSLLG